METFLQDVKFGLRALVRTPGLTAVAVLSLGIGIAANTTVFTWLRTLVTRPMPAVAGYDRLVWVHSRAPGGGTWALSYPEYRDLRQQSRSVDLAVTGFTELGMRLEGSSTGTERVWAVAASDNYFDVLRVPVALGRAFQRGEEDAAAQVAVLGWAFWRHRFHADSSIVGRTIVLNGQTFTVIGVAAPRFGGTIVGLQMDMFLPVTTRTALLNDGDWRHIRGWRWMDGVARLRPGVTFAQAAAEVDQTGKAIARAAGDDDVYGEKVRHMDEEGPSSWFKPVFPALLGITAVVLLIACANVANLLLARAAARRREIAIRLAVGAGRARLVRQLLTESLTLALMAGAVGMLLTLWSRDGLSAFVPASPFPVALDYRVDAAVLAFALVVTVATALIFGLAPAVQASRPDLVPALKDDVAGAFGGGGRHRLQSTLVVVQVALSLTSLVCAGLFVRSLTNSRMVEYGFRDPEHVLLISTDMTLAGVRGDSAVAALTDALLQRVRALPGVTAAGIVSQVPLGFGGGSSSSADIQGYQPKPNENMAIATFRISPGYMEAMRMPVVAGRAFKDGDEKSGNRGVVVNQAFVDKYWPGLDPIGRWIDQFGRMTVVGVVKTGKYYQISEDPTPVIYQPVGRDRAWNSFTVNVRTVGDPNAMTDALRAAFKETSADLPFLDVRTMAESMQAALFNQRIAAYLLTIFGAVALVLSAIGLYGVMAYTVSQRTREIGVRIALGAGRRDVVRMVLGRAVRLAGLGLGVGLVIAFVAARLLRSLLYGVGAADPLTFLGIGLLLGGVALLAGWLPARRAAGVDPLVALRSE